MRQQPSPLAEAFAPLMAKRVEILILGSMPGVRSLEEQRYYAHPQNAFWPIMQTVYNCEIDTYTRREALIRDNRLALWDVLKQCRRSGSLDAKIEKDSIVCNDFDTFFTTHSQSLRRILFNGRTAETLFKRHVLATIPLTTGLQLHGLPSTSPAMASLRREQKLFQWQAALTL